MAESLTFCEDCMSVMARYPDKYFDLAVVDPPYGVNIGKHGTIGGAVPVGPKAQIGGAERDGHMPFGDKSAWRKARKEHEAEIKSLYPAKTGTVFEPKVYHAFDDSTIPDSAYFAELQRVSKHRIIWGGNYFLDFLGRTNCMIFWDKDRHDLDFADGEFAWTDFAEPSRRFLFRWNGLLQGNMKNKETRIHPTQKPVALYAWIFQRYAKPGFKILDTHLGSGSSRIAAYDAGLDFVGCELDKVYFELEEERFARHAAQGNLFLELDG